MRMLMLPRYGRLGASSRVRMYQYLPGLRAAGIEIDASPLFDDDYVRALYAQQRPIGSILSGYTRRLARLLRGGEYDAVWIEKELLPWLPAAIERLLWPRSVVVVDYDDAVFHRYDMHPSGLVRAELGRKIDAVMRRADLVTAGNGYLAARAFGAGCTRVERLPTVVDLSRYPPGPSPSSRESDLVTIGWIGSPATAEYLGMVAPALQQLARTHAIRCVAVGARPDQVDGTSFEAVPWTEVSEAAQVADFDIGLMPLPDEPWERGKCGYKLIQYMACGLPVVASPVGVNPEIVSNGVNGELATSTEEWVAALSRLIENPELRVRQGTQGRQRVQAWYSLQAQTPRLVSMLHDAAARRRKH